MELRRVGDGSEVEEKRTFVRVIGVTELFAAVLLEADIECKVIPSEADVVIGSDLEMPDMLVRYLRGDAFEVGAGGSLRYASGQFFGEISFRIPLTFHQSCFQIEITQQQMTESPFPVVTNIAAQVLFPELGVEHTPVVLIAVIRRRFVGGIDVPVEAVAVAAHIRVKTAQVVVALIIAGDIGPDRIHGYGYIADDIHHAGHGIAAIDDGGGAF